MIRKVFVLCVLGALFFHASALALDDSPILVQYQEKLQQDLTLALNKVIGRDSFVASVRVKVKDEMRVQKNIFGNTKGGMSQELQMEEDIQVMPGIPDKDADRTDSSVPKNSIAKTIYHRIDKVTVVLTVDKSLSAATVEKAKDFVRRFVPLNEKKGDRLEIIAIDFVKDQQIADAAGRGGERGALDDMQKMLDEKMRALEDKLGGSPDRQRAEDPRPDNKGGDEKKPLGEQLKQKGWLLALIVLAVILFIALLILLPLMLMKAGRSGEESSGRGMGGIPERMGAESVLRADTSQNDSEKDDTDKPRDIEKEKHFFDFVTKDNIEKLYHLLHVKVALNEASTKTITMVLSFLEPDLRASLLLQFPQKIQAEIVKNLTELDLYDLREIEALDQELHDKMIGLIGGQNILVSILDSMSDESKSTIVKEIDKRYPSAMQDIRNIVILFEDIFELPDDQLALVMDWFDLEVIAMAVAGKEEWENRIYEIMPAGRREMLRQTIEYSKGYTKFEQERARKAVIDYAKQLDDMKQVRLKRRV